MSNYIKVRFLRGDEPGGKEYTYAVNMFTPKFGVGDKVIIKPAADGKDAQLGVCTAMNVNESEVESFKDKIKTIYGVVLEHKAYSAFAFSPQEREIMQINTEVYNDLIKKYRICRSDGFEWNPADYDLVYSKSAEHLHSEVTIHQNNTDMSSDELALIFDGGNLCFGYSKQDDTHYYINED